MREEKKQTKEKEGDMDGIKAVWERRTIFFER